MCAKATSVGELLRIVRSAVELYSRDPENAVFVEPIRKRQEQREREQKSLQERNRRKEERKGQVQKVFSCSGPIYENCRMIAPDGEVLWYVIALRARLT